MARPLRRNVRGGWYHVFHRATERGRAFADDEDREHFLELLAELVVRYRVVINAYALMNTHYHALVQTPEANLSQALQWLHLSYAAWFNARHNRLGPFWQGRFRAVPVEDGEWAYTVSLYVHLNPVCTEWFGLNKGRKRAEAQGWLTPSKEEATRRLRQLRTYPWSSFPAYAGYSAAPTWLCRQTILERAHRDPVQRQAQYRRDAQKRLTHGTETATMERLADRVGIGSQTFLTNLKALAHGGDRETSDKRLLRRRVAMRDVMRAVEQVRGEPWAQCRAQRGDWARPLVMWAARRYGGLTLREIGDALGGMDYAAVGMALRRFEHRTADSPELADACRQVATMLTVET